MRYSCSISLSTKGLLKPRCPFLTLTHMCWLQLASASPSMQSACMDIKAAFRNSLIWPPHKAFCVVEWDGSFMDHVFPFGLATTPGVKGCVTDATIGLLDSWDVAPVFKWVSDFNIMCEQCRTVTHDDGSAKYFYAYE